MTHGFSREILMNTSTIILNDAKFTQSFGRSKSAFIRRLHFWINKAETNMNSIGIVHEGKRWIYNTAEEWGRQIGYSERQTQRIVSDLIKENVILLEKLGRYKKTNTNFYTINYEKLTELDLATASAPKEIQRTNKERNTVITTPTNSSSPVTEPHMRAKRSNTTVQDMHAIWNSTFPNNQFIMTKDLGRYLYAAHKNNFNFKLEEWSKYCTVLSAQNPNGISIETALRFNTLNLYKNTQNQVPTQRYQEQVSQGTIHSAISTQLPESEVDVSKSQEMLDIWNRVFENKSSATMTPELKILLGQALKDQFKSQVDEWKCYCQTIKGSKYIMGADFKLHLKWALKQETVEKIKNKFLGVTEIIVPFSSTTNTLTAHLSKMASQEDEFCLDVRKAFLKIYGERDYLGWLLRVGLRIENRQLIIVTENQYVKDQISLHYTKIFEYVAKNAPCNVPPQQENVSPSLQFSDQKGIRPNYTKILKMIPGIYIPHDIKQKYIFNAKGYLNKVDLVLKYVHTRIISAPQGDLNKTHDATLLEVSDPIVQQELHHLKEEGRGGDKTTHTKTLTSVTGHNNLSKHQFSQEIDIQVLATPIDEDLNLSSLKIKDDIEYLNSIKSKKQIETISLNDEYPHEEKQYIPNLSTTNVVKEGGSLRHLDVLYNTVITNQQNNNLIRATSPTNEKPTFTSLLDESNPQVRNYYLKIIYWKKNIQKEVPEIKHTSRTMGLFRKEADLDRKSSYQPPTKPCDNWIQQLENDFKTICRGERSVESSNIIIADKLSWTNSHNKIKSINSKRWNPRMGCGILPPYNKPPEGENDRNFKGIKKSHDCAYDSGKNRNNTFDAGMIPNIKENPRNGQSSIRGRKKVFCDEIYEECFRSIESGVSLLRRISSSSYS